MRFKLQLPNRFNADAPTRPALSRPLRRLIVPGLIAAMFLEYSGEKLLRIRRINLGVYPNVVIMRPLWINGMERLYYHEPRVLEDMIDDE